MKKIILSLILIAILITTISASRLPSVGSDNETWGTILNDYLAKIGGDNATELNSIMVNGTNIYSSAINSTHIETGSVSDDEIDYSTVTLADFTNDANYLDKDEGGTIDGSLTVNGNLTFIGNYLNATVTNQYLNGSFFPDITDLFNLGSAVYKWANLYVSNIYASKVYSDDWTNVSITESQVSDADWWDADDDISANEISESKVNFATTCPAGSHLYVNGNDLACEADNTASWTNDSTETSTDLNVRVNGNLNVTGTSYLGSMDFTGGNITATRGNFESINVTGTSYLGDFQLDGDLNLDDGTISSGNINVYQPDDTNGVKIYGYDDMSSRYLNMYVNSGGNVIFQGYTGRNLYFNNAAVFALSAGFYDEAYLKLGSNDGMLTYWNEGNKSMKFDYYNNLDASQTTRMIINGTSGDVGIGTTTPQNTLNVVGDLNVTGSAYLGDLTWNGNLDLGDNNITNVSYGFFNDRVGIGTDTPSVPLEVNGNVKLIGNNGYLMIADNNNLNQRISLQNIGGKSTFDFVGGDLYIRDDALDAKTRLFIQNTIGNIGINTSTPQNTLNVVGDLNVTGNTYLGDLTWNGNLDLGDNNITNVSYGFFTDRVGIGTSTPQNTLNVVGDLNVTGNYISGANTGLTGNYSIGECWMAYTGGIVTSTNCTAL